MFEYELILFGLIAVPFFLMLMVADILKTRKRIKRISGTNADLIVPYYSEFQKWLRVIFYTIAFALTILAVARPRWGFETIEGKVTGRDILILLDVSNSMSARDIQPSRLEAAKRGIKEVLESGTGDRFGLMTFSGKSEVLCPVTQDYSAIDFFVQEIYPGMIGKGGTNIGRALQNASDIFEEKQINNKMILLITDGENLQGNLKGTLDKIKKSDIKVFTIGIGQKNGEPIPVLDENGNVKDYLLHDNGQMVISRLDEKNLRMIARETGGDYYYFNGKKNELTNILYRITTVDKDEQENIKSNQKKERYHIFLIPALILFAAGFILDQGRFLKLKTKRFHWVFDSQKKNLILFVFIFISLINGANLFSQDSTDDYLNSIKKGGLFGKINGGFFGDRLFKKEKYEKALDKYYGALPVWENDLRKSTKKRKTRALNEYVKLNYNIGNTYLKLNNPQNAAKYYKISLEKVYNNNKLKADILYNMGLSLFELNEYQKAAEVFKETLLINDQDEDARYNYAVCREMIQNNQDQNQDNKKENQDKNQQNNQEQNNDDQNKENPDQNQGEKKESAGDQSVEDLLKALEEKEKDQNRKNAEKNKDTSRIKQW